MRLRELLCENFRLLTRDNRGNWLSQGVDEIMADSDAPKTILKVASTLTVHPNVYPEINDGFYIEVFGYNDQGRIRETFHGEAVPVLRFILSRWPQYGTVVDDETGISFADIAKQGRPRLANQREWYHGTASLHVPEIMRLGLRPRDTSERNYAGLGGSETGMVYLAADRDAATMHAENAARKFGGAPTVLQIDLTGLEDRIVDDHDVRVVALGKKHAERGDRTTQRVKANPGESSYLTLGTIAFKGRIPPNRIKVVWQGKEKVGRKQKYSVQYQFVNQLGALAKQLTDRHDLHELFRIVGVRPSHYYGRTFEYADNYYDAPDKTMHSVYRARSQPKRFEQWLNGMRLRAGRWRGKTQNPAAQQIVQLIDQMYAELQNAELHPAR